ncbi:FtsX-like permease family protein [Acidiferrimicrobium sp. IK]|uniref:FtsX-like permease family protein n=1 Tax=Acidiferrimicrobium sp. IK TaxID=2871700 RepID=UPI0021CB2096|nr:FtsX-like permease family protein [Acidiferrimicrobium sp. IK]MCU4185957.1 FtsX-like permease family protein [Acidiferrimicrobium sp. IK]
MSAILSERPAPVEARSGGGRPARRAVARWGWRLFRREWRRHLLVLSMLTLAVAATIVGLGTATNATKLKADPTFGTANTIVTLSGSNQRLAADIAALRAKAGPLDVVAHQQLAIPGSVASIDIRDQAPGGTFDRVTLRLDAGSYPAGPGEVALTSGLARQFDLKIGSTWTAGGTSRRVVGIVENPLNLLDEFALVAPGQARPPTTVSIFTSWHPGPGRGLGVSLNGSVSSRGPQHSGAADALVLALGTIGLLFVGLMAVAGFTVMAQRHQRALGMLSSLGATDRQVRLVMLADGAAVGALGALAGGVIGVGAWLAFVPTLQATSGHRIDRFGLPWWAVGVSLVLAVLTALIAAWWPARAITKASVIAAFAGRPSPPRSVRRFSAVGAVLVAGGLALLYFSDHGSDHTRPPFIVLGALVTPIGLLFLAPLAIRVLAAAAARTGVAVRLALRDLVRYQARSGAALGSITLALAITATIAVSSAASSTPDPVGNLAPDQLMMYVTPDTSAGQVPPLSAPQLGAVTGRLDQLARAIHATMVPLEQAYSPAAGLQPPISGPGGRTIPAGYPVASLAKVTIRPRGVEISGGFDPLYVATPALLAHYGISPSAVSSGADILTARSDLAGRKLFALQSPVGPGTANGGPPKVADVTPTLQHLTQLPRYSSAPGSLLTTAALQRLGLTALPGAWLVQAAHPLTGQQIHTAQAAAAGLGLYVEARTATKSSAALRNWSTAVGVLLALGVLGMTVGLIRSETAGALRILAAAGAGSATRRTITGATSGALALLGALLGTAGAYAALLVWYRSDLSPLGRVPVVNLVLIVAGLPLLASGGGWLLAGREPPAIARRPLD